MGGKGLEASMWASRRNAAPAYTQRSGDWDCPACKFSNFASRQVCFRCSHAKNEPLQNLNRFATSQAGQRENNGYQSGSKPSSASSSTLSLSVADKIKPPIHHGHPPLQATANSQVADPLEIERLNPDKYGLSTSRWAPRNQSRSQSAAKPPQIWTRTVPVVKPKPYNHETSPISKPPDLGLPYEVQHYILAMIERILEEACFDFASRWIPQTLLSKNWSCPEAVELATWRDVLPEALPLKSIIPVANYTLEQGLIDAVRVRNSAAHRHLCDNFEIRRMATKAQDLMFMFSDHTRQLKFQALREVLNEWDAMSGQNPQGARERLETALKGIGERPIDDMDWTPNAVSLQEVGHEEVKEIGENHVPIRHGHVIQDYDGHDEMELDDY